jgi:hypothetical protein
MVKGYTTEARRHGEMIPLNFYVIINSPFILFSLCHCVSVVNLFIHYSKFNLPRLSSSVLRPFSLNSLTLPLNFTG